nr:pentatricopeptide repeat-containing protein [Tanacetum cinerariifolium]
MRTSKKFPIHDEQTHCKMRKSQIGEKYVDVDQLKECLTYYALENRSYGKAISDPTEDHYAMIMSYGKAVLDSNDSFIVKLGVIVNPDDKTYFD